MTIKKKFHTPAEACRAVGLDFDGVTPLPGSSRRLDVTGDLRGKNDGSICTSADGKGGCVTNFKTSTTVTWSEDGKAHQYKKQCTKRDTQLKELWRSAQPVKMHPYCKRKGIEPTKLMRQVSCEKANEILGWAPSGLENPLLCIPLTDGKEIVSMQFIDTKGQKRFLKGAETKGAYWFTGKAVPGKPIGIAEGVATAISVAMVNEFPVIAAMSCGNLKAVAKKIRAKYPKNEIIIIGDVGRGEREAHEAARCAGAKVAFPPFTPEMIASFNGGNPSDFNDLYCILAKTNAEEQILIQDIATEPEGANSESSKGEISFFVPPPLWEGEVSFSDTLSDCVDLLRTFIWMEKEQAIVCSLWAAATWFVKSVVAEDDHVPYLLISSKTKECGKTKLLDFLAKIVRHPVKTGDSTAAAIFRVMEKDTPTLMLDETDQYLNQREGFVQILNAGNKPGAKVLRSAGNAKGGFTDEVRAYDCFGFKAVVGILAEELQEAITSRSIVIKLLRKPPAEGKRVKFGQYEQQFASLRSRFYTLSTKYGQSVQKQIAEAKMIFPSSLTDRQADGGELIWAMLECMADEKAQEEYKSAYIWLCKQQLQLSDKQILLHDIYNHIQDYGKKWIKSSELIKMLSSNPEWSDLSPKKLACKLGHFNVRPQQISQENNVRGYSVEKLKHAYVANT